MAVAVVVSPSDPELRHFTDAVPRRDRGPPLPPPPPPPSQPPPDGTLLAWDGGRQVWRTVRVRRVYDVVYLAQIRAIRGAAGVEKPS